MSSNRQTPPVSLRRRLTLALALTSVPVTALALSSFENVEVKDPLSGINYFDYNYGAVSIGSGNSFNSGVQHTLAVGTTNSFTMTAPNSAAVGTINYLSATATLAAGTNNSVTAGYSSALGRGLIVNSQGVAVGEYNDPFEFANEAFTVGIGTSGAGNSKNGFVVLKDGSVIIPEPQGDVPLGIYQ